MSFKTDSMRWLLSQLGLLKKERSTNELKAELSVDEELSFFQASAKLNTIDCQWGLRRQTKELISQSQGTMLMIRIRDASGDGTIATKSVEIGRDATRAQISIPDPNGQILLELGYKTPEGDFITLEYKFIDFGVKENITSEPANWFTNESENIHQEMYALATKGLALGGSEQIQINR